MELLEQHFDTAFAAPDGIKKLRELILTLAMQGKLVPQDPSDPPASQLLKEIEAAKSRLWRDGKIKAPIALPEIAAAEVPYELPPSWEWVRVGDVCSYIQRGKGPVYADSSSHRVVSQKCVRWHGLDLEPARFIDPGSLSKYEPVRFLRGGDLLWNSTGTGTIGRACLVPDELDHSELVADSHVTVVRTLLLTPAFLWRWIQSPIVQGEIESVASGTTNQIELNTSTVINHLMPLPPSEEQHRIVVKIDQLMTRCDEMERLRAEREQKRRSVHTAALKQLLDTQAAQSIADAWQFISQHFGDLYAVKENVTELRKAVLQLAVMGKLVPQNRDDPPASQLLKEIEAEKKRLVKEGKIKAPKPLPEITAEEIPYALPQGWEWVRFFGINLVMSELVSAREFPLEKQIAPDSIEKGSGRLLFHRTVAEFGAVGPNNRFYEGQILYSKIRPSLNKAVIAPYDGLCSADMYPIKTYVNPDYMLKTILSEVFLMQVRLAENRIKMPKLNLESLGQFIVPLPPLPEQRRIVAKIDQLMVLCDTLEQRIDDANSKQTELLDAVMAQV